MEEKEEVEKKENSWKIGTGGESRKTKEEQADDEYQEQKELKKKRIMNVRKRMKKRRGKQRRMGMWKNKNERKTLWMRGLRRGIEDVGDEKRKKGRERRMRRM